MNETLHETKILSHEISTEISNIFKHDNPDDIKLRHLDGFDYLTDIEFEKSIVVFGLNPSSTDLDAIGKSNPCFLHYVPESDFNKTQHSDQIKSEIKKRKYTYDAYFKKPYNLFYDLNLNYIPIWKNETYISKMRYELKIPENDIVFDFLKSIKSDSKKFLIFTDLIQYKETSANKIEALFSDLILRDKVIKLFELQLLLYKAKYVFINNAFASHIIHNHIKQKLEISDGVYSSLEYNGTTFIFSSLITGVRALDLYSLERLKNEIKSLISNN